jgi:molecular chaperone GrpE
MPHTPPEPERENRPVPETEPETPIPPADAADAPSGEGDAPAPTQDYDALNDRYLRLRAEYENYRRRTMQEKQDAYENAKLDTVSAYLPLYDNLTRAASAACADESYAQGVRMLATQMTEIMGRLGVTETPALNEPFDPNVHNAIQHVEDEGLGANVVAEVYAPGFRSDKRVLRPSMVKVAN